MKIISCLKAVPEVEDISVSAGGELSTAKAKLVISNYDLNAVEEGAKLALETSGSLVALSAGGAEIDNSKLKKDILSRGPEELFMVADGAAAGMDSLQTAKVLAAAVAKIGEYDLILLGEGSADVYAQQVGIQLGELLGVPTLNGVASIESADGAVVVERMLEHEIEKLKVSLPAVLCVTPDINEPRIPGMRELLSAGKKPSTLWGVADLGIDAPAASIEVESVKAPEKVERKNIVFNGDSDEVIDEFIAAIRAEFK